MHARITSDCDFQTIRLEIEYPLGGGHGRPHLATMHRSTEMLHDWLTADLNEMLPAADLNIINNSETETGGA